ncbi:MAG TPA: thiamine pyrophosphate-dependent dehydrogenase E1 component subunit alpha [Chthoniobacterales bacterium]|nr:thiamine pyrophosphate-dependent dehydrogenase E1 component subunit alpha [Chthoniobacterales bacterium]
MLNTLKEPQRDALQSGFQEQYVKAFKWMLLARTVEEKVANLWHAGKIVGGVYIGKGQEAVSVAIGMMLRRGDIFAPLIRDQGGRLAFGEPLLDILRTYLGVRTGPMRGRDGNVHRGHPREGIYPMISHLGAMISVVGGALLARRMKGISGTVGATSIGDGGTSTGAFHEGINFAAVEKLPLVLVVTNNRYAYSTPNSRQFACHDLVDKAIGYGIEGYSTDGTDLRQCLEVMGHAVDRARNGAGPQLVVASCLRLTGHAEHDDAAYMDEELFKEPLGRDCIDATESFLIEQNWANENTLKSWKQEAKAEVEAATQQVQREPTCTPADENWMPLATRRLADF